MDQTRSKKLSQTRAIKFNRLQANKINKKNQIAYTPRFKAYLDNIPIPSLTTPLGKSLRNDTVNRMDPTFQPTIVHLKQSTVRVHSDRKHVPVSSLNSDNNFPISKMNVDNHTEMKPQGPIVTTIPESHRANNCDIFNSVRKTLDLAYRGLAWYGTMKN